MPLTKEGKKILGSMKKQYGGKKGKQVFYASINKGTIKGAEGNPVVSPVTFGNPELDRMVHKKG